MAQKLVNESGLDRSLDRASQSPRKLYVGDPAEKSADATYVQPTGAFRDAFGVNASDAVIDCYNFDTPLLVVDYVKGAGTGMQIKVSFGDVDDRTKLTLQEIRDDNSPAGLVKHETVIHQLDATFRGLIEIPRLGRYFKVEHKSLGAPDATDKIAIAVIGQNREGRS